MLTMHYRFGEFELDGDGRELRRRTDATGRAYARVESPRQALAFLRVLVEHAPRIVTREELLGSVWQGQTVSQSALNTVVKVVRRVLGGDGHRFVRTMHGVGYAFVGPVERRRVLPSTLSSPRDELFVGRDAELRCLGGWLEDPASDDARLYWVHGIGGIGKTSLLHRLERMATELGIPAIFVSCAHLRPRPEALTSEIAASFGAPPGGDPLGALAAHPTGVLVLDGYEAIAGIDDWLRERWVQRIPPGWRLVLSGRNPPGVRWRADPAWTRAAEIHVRDLSRDEARALLERRGVARARHDRILELAGGHPLSLVLAIDSLHGTEPAEGTGPSATAALSAALLDSFVGSAPSTHHRDALDCIALVDALDEPLLVAMMDGHEAAGECFGWLSTLGIVERHPAGLALHDLAKSALVADLAWRNTARLGRLVERAYEKLFADLEVVASPDRRRRIVTSVWRLFDLHPEIASVLSLPKLVAVPSDSELRAIEAHVHRFEGDASASALRFWLARDPACARIVRDENGDLLGYAVLLKVDPGDHEARAADPVLAALDASLEQPGRYSVTRWFADCRAYHDVTPVSAGCHTMVTESEMSELDDGLCCHFMLVSNPEAWRPFVRLADIAQKMSDVELAEHRLVAFAHDMRGQTLLTWFRSFTAKIMGTLATGAPIGLASPHEATT